MKNQQLFQFQAYLTEKGYEYRTIDFYLQDTQYFLTWYKATYGYEVATGELHKTTAQVYYTFLLENTNKASAHRRINALVAFVRWLQLTKKVTHGIAIPIISEKPTQPTFSPLDAKMVKELLAAIDREIAAQQEEFSRGYWRVYRDALMVRMLLVEKLDEKTIQELDESDCVLADGRLQISHRNANGEQKTYVLSQRTEELLTEYLNIRPGNGSTALFLSQQGDRLSNRTICRADQRFRAHMAEKGTARITPGTLKKTQVEQDA